MIPYGRQDVTPDDIDAVVDTLRSDYLTQGPRVPEFEVAVAEHVNASHAVALNSATSALHIACLALGLSSGDWLWTSPITFVASANCGLYCGADVDFVDIDEQTFNICPAALEIKLAKAEKMGRLPKVLVVVHLCGQPCDMKAIHQLARRYGFSIIEDASHAIGGRYKGEYIGSGQYSQITVFSFHPVKIITTAEGGMALTNCAKLATKMRLLRSHGITRDLESMTHAPDGPWYYQQIDLGFNYRMTELQAALGISQLKRLDQNVSRRHQLARLYDKLLANLPVVCPYRSADSYSAFHLYVIRLNRDRLGKTRRAVFESLHQQGIGVNVHYIPVHQQPYFEARGFRTGDFPAAEAYYSQAISLPMYASLTEEQVIETVNALQKALAP